MSSIAIGLEEEKTIKHGDDPKGITKEKGCED